MAKGDLPADVKEAADKLAAFVAQNGRKYEQITRDRNSRESPLGFLWDTRGAAYRYYAQQLAQFEARPGVQQQHPPGGAYNGTSSAGARSDAAVPGSKRSRWSEGPSAAGGTAPSAQQHSGAPHGSNSSSSSRGGPPSGASRYPSSSGPAVPGGSSGGAGGSTLAAMDAYMKRLEQRDKAGDDPDSDEERRRRAAPLLKETGFDRRKVVAVYTQDGKKGHHMQDFIPPEEMAKFMEACGDKEAAARAAASQAGGLGADNIGHKLLQKMGWKEGQGLGGQSHGNSKPVVAQGQAGGSGGLGLGAAPHGAVDDDDDEYTRYRKRMQLGYKYRPNPLGNPRKQYY